MGKEAKNTDIDILFQMLLIRRFEERASQQYQQQKIGGFCHLYIGQEAVAVGTINVLRPDDYIITAYRDHGHALARGTSADSCMAELFGKASGCSKGLGGSMHFFDVERHMYGGHAIVAGHVPLAAGMAFASKYRDEDRVTVCYLGDGAINQGSFHESLNMAGLFELPVIYIVENNQFAMGTHVKRSIPMDKIVDRAKGYGMKSAVIDGMDVRNLMKDFAPIVEDVRKTKQPWFIEAETYRYRGHSMSDPATYRTREELEKHKEQDPITKLQDDLITEKLLTQEKFDELDKKARQIAVDSVRFAESSEEPPLDELYNYTYYGETVK
ncbi:MAG: pyruvate dehydrogenase (acetyl-transferring) E1 component subunit alpha [Chthoniobacterales bacterium]